MGGTTRPLQALWAPSVQGECPAPRVRHRMSSHSCRGLHHVGQGHPWQETGEAGPGSCCPLPVAGTFLSFRARPGNSTTATGSSQRPAPHFLPGSVFAVATDPQMARGAVGLFQPSEQVSWVARPWTGNLGIVWEVLVHEVGFPVHSLPWASVFTSRKWAKLFSNPM